MNGELVQRLTGAAQNVLLALDRKRQLAT